MADPFTFARDGGETIAYRRIAGRGPGILWLGGFHSDMSGSKAQALSDWAEKNDRAFLRFDYFGHGESSGDFAAGTISRWRDDALAVLDELTEGPQMLVGSSMGGWISTLLAHARPERVAGMLLIAPAPDFTEDLIWSRMPPEVQAVVQEKGVWNYAEGGYPITRTLLEDGRNNLVLNKILRAKWPVRILHGTADTDVPWQQGFKLVDQIEGDVTFTLVKGADHRISSPTNLKLIEITLEALLKEMDAC
ncbi:hypothetical protein FHS83_000168 [Rhizomicrobium palustre]|uniref:Serine aminopeptidase S33 domain-containing protein n=1 Tax=Rhizomicrobium palustre TaxID=189966 RepID=A0A846MUU8_9PROT|nr:alpha/beta hydrolase [Rhizomicrobium palustre]NIK86850.1 hypothetical protein [Rhizomicrobium palustre]